MKKVIILCLYFVLNFSYSTQYCANSFQITGYYWRDYKGILPKDAVNFTGDLHVGQTYYEGILPGTFYKDRQEVVTECRGERRIIKDPIKILCDRRRDNFEWEHVNVDWLSHAKVKDMVIGGFEVGHTLYVGRTFHEGLWKIGKVFAPPYQYKGLTVWHNDGRQLILHDFEILKYLNKYPDEGFTNDNCVF